MWDCHPKSLREPKEVQHRPKLGPSWRKLAHAGFTMASRWLNIAPRWLQHGIQRSQDGSRTAHGASKTPLRRLQDRPQDAFRTAPSAPKAPPWLSKSLQDGSGILQDASQNSPEEFLELPSRFQELFRGAFQASSCCPAASSLWPPSGLGGMREALTIKL